MSQLSGSLTILSGGEPFEHPEIAEILDTLGCQANPFRIATGGFIDLSPWIDQLCSLSRLRGPLEGISMGTDILSSRVDHSKWVSTWINNLQLFAKFQIPYSLTITLGSSLAFTRLDLGKWKALFEDKPQFIYLRHSREDFLDEWILNIRDVFGDIDIIQDEIICTRSSR